MTAPKTREDWQALAARLSIRHQAFIDGRFVDAASGKRFDCISPVDGRVLAQVAQGGIEDINRAVSVARKAFNAGVWSGTSPRHRKGVLQAFARLLERHADELAESYLVAQRD